MIGQLSNGALGIANKPSRHPDQSVVLAINPGGPWGEPEFVTWIVSHEDCLCSLGKYFGQDFDAAVEDFNKRS